MRSRSALGLFATHLFLINSAYAFPIFDAIPELSLSLSQLTSFPWLHDAGTYASGGGHEGFASSSAMGDSRSEGEGWLARWLAFGGEGEVMIQLPNTTLLLPHRPASFPSYLPHYLTLPISGHLISIESLSNSSSASSHSIDSPAIGSPSQACSPPPFSRWYPPKRPYTIALIERGACDFASKVLYAQSLGAAAVIVGDTKAYPGETDEEGRERRGLLTMFSPSGEVEEVRIPSVFVSRAGYLLLRDLLVDGVVSEPEDRDDGQVGSRFDGGHQPALDEDGTAQRGETRGKIQLPGVSSNTTALWIELGEPRNEGGTIGNLLSFSLLMPSCFLIITIVGNRARVARQRRLDRAPPEVVLALPERVWQPDIAWEKSSSSSASVSPSGHGRVRGSAHGSGSGSGRGGRGELSRHSGGSSTGTSPSPFSRQSGQVGDRSTHGARRGQGLAVDTGIDMDLAATLPNTVPLQAASGPLGAGPSGSAGTGAGPTGRSRSSTAMSSTSAQTMHTALTSHSRPGDSGPSARRDAASAPISPVDAFAHPQGMHGSSSASASGSDESNTPTPTASTFRTGMGYARTRAESGEMSTRHGRTRDHSAPLATRFERDRRSSHSHSRSRDRTLQRGLEGPIVHDVNDGTSPASAARTAFPADPSTQTIHAPQVSSTSHTTRHPHPLNAPHAHVQKRFYAQDECAICMDDFQPGQIVRILPCGHVFHKDECDEWLMKWRKLCPTCRADVTVPARAMAGSTITPVILRNTAGNEVLTAEPGFIEPDAHAAGPRGLRLAWMGVEPVRDAIRGVRDGAVGTWGWVTRGLRGAVRRQRAGEGERERERLVPRPNGDEV